MSVVLFLAIPLFPCQCRKTANGVNDAHTSKQKHSLPWEVPQFDVEIRFEVDPPEAEYKASIELGNNSRITYFYGSLFGISNPLQHLKLQQ